MPEFDGKRAFLLARRLLAIHSVHELDGGHDQDERKRRTT